VNEMDLKGGEKLDHRAGPTGFKVNTLTFEP
jgi:hypothetical protein